MYIKKILCLLLIIISGINFAQTKISGIVKDKSNLPLPGANVFIKDSYDGNTSGSDGKFSFVTEEKGEAILVASFVGYKQFQKNVTLEGKELVVDIVLEEETKVMRQVVISAGSFEASDENKAVILRPLDVVTTGAEADIYSALETLPGTQQIGETEGLFVRGGSASETKTIIDEMIVQKPFYSSVPDIPARGRFTPFLFKGTVFSTGGYSAQYGQALSSVLILKTQDLAPATRTTLNLMAVGFGAAHSSRWDESSLSFESGYYNMSPYFKVQKQKTDWQKAPESFESSLNYRIKTSETGMIKAFSSFSYGDFSLYTPNLNNLSVKDFTRIKGGNFFFNTSYKEIFGEDWTFFSGYSYSHDEDNINLNDNRITQRERLNTGKVTVTKGINDNSFLTFGSEYRNVEYFTKYNQYDVKLIENYIAGYIETDIFFNFDFAIRLGLRSEYSKLLNKTNFAPRVSLAYKLGEYDQLNFAYGQFYQTPDVDYLMLSKTFDYERADHYIFNYQYIGKRKTFRIELYYKDYNNLAKGTVITYPYFNLPSVAFSNKGKGYAKGIDIFWRDSETITMSDYWISYSYLDTKRDYKNYPTLAAPPFSTPHTFSVVFKHWFPEITTSLGLTYSFATGRPYFNPNNPQFLGDRGKNFHNLSMNVSYLTSLFNSFTIIFFSVDNLFGYANVYGYRYSDDGKIKAAVLPQALRWAFVGAFISLGEKNPY